MKTEQLLYIENNWQKKATSDGFDQDQCQLVLAFGEPALIADLHVLTYLRTQYAQARIVLTSTAGEILQDTVYDHTISVTAIHFAHTITRCAEAHISDYNNSEEIGTYLMKELLQDDLTNVFIISDGKHINGSELVAGFNAVNTTLLPVTGGLAGDGDRFTRTLTGLDQLPEEGVIVAIGFYGKRLKIAHGSFGGWDEFGPTHTITRSQQNNLLEIDGKNALDLYKEYLGPYQDKLPGSALLFPLSVRQPGYPQAVVRTILGVDEENKSLIFAGNMPKGSQIRLMQANFNKLIEGSGIAASYAFHKLNTRPDLAILISCVGRKLILQERANEEVQAALDIFGPATKAAGFYSYGEISPSGPNSRCELHNQTMTITTFTEL